MKKFWFFASLILISASVCGGNSSLFFGNIECKNTRSNVQRAPLLVDQHTSQSEQISQLSNEEYLNKATQDIKNMLGIGQESMQDLRSDERGEYIAFLTYNLQEKAKQIQEKNEQIAQLLQQIQEYSEQNTQLQKLVKEKESLQLGNALLSHRNRELLTENVWLQEQLRKHREFFSSSYNRKNKRN